MQQRTRVGRRAITVAAALLVGLGWAGSARASSVTGFTATASTYSAGASAVEYSIHFTATTAIPATTGFIELTAPAGATLSGSAANYHVQANGTSPTRTEAANVITDPGGAGNNVADVYVPNAIATGATVVVDAYMSTNPSSEAQAATFSMSTSADTTAPTPVAFAITGPTVPSDLSATSTSPDAGSQEVEDTVTFTSTSSIVYINNGTFPTQCLDGECNQGGIFLTAPAGARFDSFSEDYQVKDLTTSQTSSVDLISQANPTGGGVNTLEVQPDIPIAAGDRVEVLAYEVENPPSPGPGALSVSTTSDVTPVTISFPTGAADAISNVSVATTSTTAGATGTTYLIGIHTTQALPYYNDGSDGTGYVVLTYPAGVSAVGVDNASVSMSDATHPTPVAAGTSPGQYGYNPQNNQVDIPVGFAVPAGDDLTIELTGVVNPATFSYARVSTTADTVTSPGELPSGVTATAGTVSAQVSWTAPPLPSGATVDYIITPFIGSTAQTPVDTLSSQTSFEVTGLTAGTQYTFEVQAELTDGSTTYLPGPPSIASNAVTPTANTAGPPQGTPSATTLAFGTEFLAATTASQTVKLFNTGGDPLAVSHVTVTGSDPGDYAIGTDACTGQSIPSGESCSVSVTFTPKASGARSAALAFTDNASGSPQTVALTGTGTDTATVSGTVTSAATGTPVAGVVVAICTSTSSATAATCGTTTTAGSGDYTLSGLMLGTATVTASPSSAAASTYHTTTFTKTLVLGGQTLDIGLPIILLPGPGVSVTGGDGGFDGGVPTAYSGAPMQVSFAPSFPSEPAGTELAVITTATMGEVDNLPELFGWSGAVVLLVSYDSSEKPTVIGQYSDTASGPSPSLNFRASSPGPSLGLIGPGYPRLNPILLQYLPNGQLQASFTPAELAPGTKQFQTCTRTAVVSSSNAAVHVQASTGSYAFGAVSPSPQVSGCSPNGGADFNLYFDPSGKVQSTTHIPLASAKVELLRAASAKGPFTAVPNGSTVMSAVNRRNPDKTNALGLFGWDTTAGDYRVQASHPGCTVPGGGKKKTTSQTRVYVVPPPVDNIVISLKCPRLKRSPSHVRLKFKAIRAAMTAVTATVKGKSPAGSLIFSGPGVRGVSLPIGKRTHHATFILTAARQRITVRYLGDAHNAPSSASGHAR